MNHLLNHKIDKSLWDRIVSSSANSRIYGLSWWLDVVHPGWQGIISKDEDKVMPLCPKGWFLKKNVQPIFTQQLGLFSLSANAKITSDLIENIKASTKHGYMQCNAENTLDDTNAVKVKSRMNLVLRPSKEQTALSRFSNNHKRNFEKAADSNLECRSIDTSEFLPLFSLHNPVYSSDIKPYDKQFLLLLDAMKKNNSMKCLGVYHNADLLAGVTLGVYNGRWTFLFPFTSPEGRQKGAMHYLIHEIITGKMGRLECLDFEGSEIEGVARFYRGFGAIDEPYPTLSW